jgi:type II secretory pathway component PulF
MSVRIEIYEALSLLVENGVPLNDALQEMHKVMSDDGRKPRRPCAIVLNDCAKGVAEGQSLSMVLAKWISLEECSLIAAGEKAGRLVDDKDNLGAFSRAIKIITAKRQILGAALTAMVYPIALFLAIAGLLNMISVDLVPKLTKATNPETWEGAAALLYWISQSVIDYGKPTMAMIIIGSVIVYASMPYLRGSIRFYFDKIPPWSIYRMLYGSTFLLNVAALLQAEIKLQDALALLANNSSPWLKERIDAAKYGVAIGGTLGQALLRAGYDFPDKRAVQYLVILSSRHGFETAINRFGDRWLDRSIRAIQVIAKVMLAGGVLLVGGLMLFILAGIGGIQDAINAGIQ